VDVNVRRLQRGEQPVRFQSESVAKSPISLPRLGARRWIPVPHSKTDRSSDISSKSLELVQRPHVENLLEELKSVPAYKV